MKFRNGYWLILTPRLERSKLAKHFHILITTTGARSRKTFFFENTFPSASIFRLHCKSHSSSAHNSPPAPVARTYRRQPKALAARNGDHNFPGIPELMTLQQSFLRGKSSLLTRYEILFLFIHPNFTRQTTREKFSPTPACSRWGSLRAQC